MFVDVTNDVMFGICRMYLPDVYMVLDVYSI